MKFAYNKIVRHAFITSALVFGAASATHAAVYAGSWDPNYGGNLAGLGWRATADLYIPDACGGSVGSGSFTGFTFGALPGSCTAEGNAIELRNVHIEFYDFGTNTFLRQLNLLNPYTLGSGDDMYGEVETQKIKALRFVNGVPVELETTYSLRSLVDGFGDRGLDLDINGNDPLFDNPFSLKLQLTSNFGLEVGRGVGLDAISPAFGGGGTQLVYFNNPGCTTLEQALGTGCNNGSQNAPNVTFRGPGIAVDVPEPGSLALTLAALVAAASAAAAARRRAR